MKQSFIDQVQFLVKAGDGGNGAIHWRRAKYITKGGPDGGKGGQGGSVILEANPHLATLRDYAGKDRFEADRGESGGGGQRYGKDAGDIVLEVPVGTVVKIHPQKYHLLEGLEWYGELPEKGLPRDPMYRELSRPEQTLEERWPLAEEEKDGWVKVADLDKPGERVVLAMGGKGGRGNTMFKSSRVTTPKFAERGERAEKFVVQLELKVLADVGLVGLPNAGKSTLLSVMTNARPEIADYPFTTLSPNLGVITGSKPQLVMADIPGLIEDAHEGKGLGIEFLRHVERCQVLLHIVSPQIESVNTDSELIGMMIKDYETIRNEIKEYSQELTKKPELVVINKMDIMTREQIAGVTKWFEDKGLPVVVVSAATTEGLEVLKERVKEMMDKKRVVVHA